MQTAREILDHESSVQRTINWKALTFHHSFQSPILTKISKICISISDVVQLVAVVAWPKKLPQGCSLAPFCRFSHRSGYYSGLWSCGCWLDLVHAASWKHNARWVNLLCELLYHTFFVNLAGSCLKYPDYILYRSSDHIKQKKSWSSDHLHTQIIYY